MKSIGFFSQRKVVEDNTIYIRDIVIGRGLELYQSATARRFTKLVILKEQIVFEPMPVATPKPAPRTAVTKYSTTEYI